MRHIQKLKKEVGTTASYRNKMQRSNSREGYTRPQRQETGTPPPLIPLDKDFTPIGDASPTITKAAMRKSMPKSYASKHGPKAMKAFDRTPEKSDKSSSKNSSASFLPKIKEGRRTPEVKKNTLSAMSGNNLRKVGQPVIKVLLS